MGLDVVAWGLVTVDRKKSTEMKKRHEELAKKDTPFEKYPKDLKEYIENNLNPSWDTSDEGWPVGEVEIPYDLDDVAEDDDDGYPSITIDVKKLPKGVIKIRASAC